MLDCRQMPVSFTINALALQVTCLAVVVVGFHAFAESAIAADPRGAPSISAEDTAPLPKVFVASFRGSAGETTARLVRQDLEDGGVFEVVAHESSDAFGIHAEATGGWIEAVVFRPSGRVLFQRRYESPNLRQNVHRFTDDITAVVTQRPGIASSVIGFISDARGDRQLYLCDSDGNDVRQVTNSPAVEAAHPCISLENGTIVYTSIKNGFADIWKIDLITEERKRLINAPGDNLHPVLAPDGDRMAVTMSYTGSTDLYVTTAKGGRGRRLTNDEAIEAHPTWSPDGRHIAYERRSQPGVARVCYVSALGGVPESLPCSPAAVSETSRHPDWSPDGHAIAFATGNADGIALFDVTSRETRVIERTHGGHSPSWAPDSRHLVYIKNNALWVLDTIGTRHAMILDGFGNVSEPFWSR